MAYLCAMKDPQSLRIIFYGTPDFAVWSLDAMVKAGYNILAVVTAPDKEAGRGRKIQASPVKQYAIEANLPIQQPKNLKDPAFLHWLKTQNPDLGVVVAFRMLPKEVWSWPPMGTINIHGSLLPNYRGAAPIQRAIMAGETETGLTSFQLQHEIDTGAILVQKRVAIDPEDDFGSLYQKMGPLGGELLLETLEGLAAGRLQPRPQGDPDPQKTAAKIFLEDRKIDWNQPAMRIHHQIRGLSPIPGAFTYWQDKTLRLFKARVGEAHQGKVNPGDFEADPKSGLRFAAQDHWLEILELQWEGRRRMSASEFLRGQRPNRESK